MVGESGSLMIGPCGAYKQVRCRRGDPGNEHEHRPTERSFVVSTAVQIGLPNLDTGRFRRPGSVRPVSVPARFRQVISPGVASQANKAGTWPLKPARAPPPWRVCSLAYGPEPDQRGCPPRPFSRPGHAWTGRVCALSSAARPPAPSWTGGRTSRPLVHAFYSSASGVICQAFS